MTRSLARIAQAVLYVAREVDHVLGMASIDNAREAVAEADRRRAIRDVLDGSGLPPVAARVRSPEFTDQMAEVQFQATSGG